MKLYRIFKLQICFHTLDIFTIHVLSEIDQQKQKQIFNGFSRSFRNVIVTFLYLRTKMP
jgi:hypothetical protein